MMAKKTFDKNGRYYSKKILNSMWELAAILAVSFFISVLFLENITLTVGLGMGALVSVVMAVYVGNCRKGKRI